MSVRGAAVGNLNRAFFNAGDDNSDDDRDRGSDAGSEDSSDSMFSNLRVATARSSLA